MIKYTVAAILAISLPHACQPKATPGDYPMHCRYSDQPEQDGGYAVFTLAAKSTTQAHWDCYIQGPHGEVVVLREHTNADAGVP